MERRLSAIFAADMVGYSRLMESDEIGTLERQKVHRIELFDPTLEKYHGRIVKEMGDGVLVEFPSVVEAVQCAVTIQREMTVREADVTDERRIQYRIGINLGDIVIEDDDIFGDGVNIAARLEQLAEPGGICISGTTYDQLKSKIKVGYESLGEVQVKNIRQAIRT
jgi:adenylate cyclase